MAGVAAATSVAIAAPASADADTTPPTVPQNLHEVTRAAGNPVVSWDPSTDTGTGLSTYLLLVDGHLKYKPKVTTFDIQTLVGLNTITAGPHVVTVQALDFAHNRSAPSNPVNIVVVVP